MSLYIRKKDAAVAVSFFRFFELSPYFVAIKLKIAGRYGDAMWYQNVIATVEIKLRM